MTIKLDTYVRFTREYEWHVPLRGVIKVYPEGHQGRVPRACAAAAKAAGAAVSVPVRNRPVK